jgi:hypothetical protein
MEWERNERGRERITTACFELCCFPPYYFKIEDPGVELCAASAVN